MVPKNPRLLGLLYPEVEVLTADVDLCLDGTTGCLLLNDMAPTDTRGRHSYVKRRRNDTGNVLFKTA